MLKTSKASGKFILRLPGCLHHTLKKLAASREVSLNELCRSLLEKGASAAEIPQAGAGPWAELVQIVASKWGSSLIGIVLFGSAARGEMAEHSDVDLMLVFKAGFPIKRQLYREWDEVLKVWNHPFPHQSEVSAHFTQLPAGVSAAGGIWFEIALDGIVLWEQELVVSRFLGQIRRQISEGRLVRENSYGHPYWIRKGAA